MLMERGRRHITVDFGNPDSEQHWELAGWSEPVGNRLQRYRSLSEAPATITYKRLFYLHFDYAWIAFRLAEPQPIRGIRLVAGGRELPIPADLINSEPSTMWQILLPNRWWDSMKTLELSLTAPGWKVTDMALLGDPILDVHLKQVKASETL
jgi:hypothetical protein